MDAKIGLLEEEYDTLIKDLSQIHVDNLEQIRTILEKIKKLNCKGGGFYFTELTPKINMILEDLENIKGKLAAVYEISEEVVASFVRTIENYDSLC